MAEEQGMRPKEEDNKGIVFNIYGGSNQILPNATKAEQIFYGDQFARESLQKGTVSKDPLTGEERRLAVFIEREESLRNYVAQLAVCKTAGDVGEVVAMMCENEPRLTEERIVKGKFIETLLPLIPGVEQGRSVDNLRIQIDKAWQGLKRTLKHK